MEPPDGAGRVTFTSQCDTIVGWLFPAAWGDGPAPGVVIIGPETYQKEQAPAQYAPRFAQLGYTALTSTPDTEGRAAASRAVTRTLTRRSRTSPPRSPT